MTKACLAAALLIGRGAVLEMVRRRDLYVVALLMALFVTGALAARVVGVDNAATGTFLLNLGLMLAYGCAHLLTLLMAARQMPDEMEQRTLHTLLARPIDRSVVLLGKWGACVACGVTVFFALALPAWWAAPRLESYDDGLLGQLLLLQPFSLALVAALALAGSLVLPRGVNLALVAGLLLASDHLIGVLLHRLDGGAAGGAVAWIALYLPDFAKLNLITRYTDGQAALPGAMLVGLIAYAAVLIGVSMAVAARVFRRRAL